MNTLLQKNLQILNPENFVPRRYQEEVFARAQKGNVIAALDTGSGKTLISILLIKWITAQEASKGKVVIFLVPKVTLVEQQGNYIHRNSPLRVLQIHGSLDVDRSKWQKRFAENDVFVMTAQLFLNLLTHSVWSIEKVSLMVFDECHHARKNHPYNAILREYFHVSPSLRPKIFGMTASPIWNPKDALGSLSTLEANMDSKVISVREHITELTAHSHKPIELVKEYPHPPIDFDYPSPTIYQCLCIFDSTFWAQFDIPWNNIEMRYFSTLYNLGPYSASLYLYLEFQSYILRIMNDYKSTLCDNSGDNIAIDDDMNSNPIVPEVLLLRDIIDGFQPFFITHESPSDTPTPIPLDWCTPKMRTLVDILKAHYTPTFQCIIFVEQRQVAACLSRILPNIPEMQDLVRCAHLVGQGMNSEGSTRNSHQIQGDAVKLFRDSKINILIATSVAEEGLDFPTCDLVIRFDPLQHMVGYVQSRGRARNKSSTYVIMIQKDDDVHLARYRALQEGEPEVSHAYTTRHIYDDEGGTNSDDDDDSLMDLAERERYVVPSTGAVLTYDNSINLLNHLCSLIPRDSFTAPHIPKFTGDFQATLHLPGCLALPTQYLRHVGPPKRSKKEAKRAVAFHAVKLLHRLDVYDDYLLPLSNGRHGGREDGDGKPIPNFKNIPTMMNVSVRNPWTCGPKLWIHTIYINGQQAAGLVTGTMIRATDVIFDSDVIHTDEGRPLYLYPEEEFERWNEMSSFTKLGIWYRITGSPMTAPSLYVVPITPEGQPDFDIIQLLLKNPYGASDWSQVNEEEYDRLMIMGITQYGRFRILRRIRDDLTPLSTPMKGSREEGYPTYRDYFVDKWSRKNRPAVIAEEGPLLEATDFPRNTFGGYSLHQKEPTEKAPTVCNGDFFPQNSYRWIPISQIIYKTFGLLPAICHRMTDIYRATCARLELHLPVIADNLLVEALTLPLCDAGWNNQRLETLGDAVLGLCTTVHLLMKYPHRHEGQLSILRQRSVSNKCLQARAVEAGLERFLTSESQYISPWRHVVSESSDYNTPERYTSRVFPRRSLQDCMEAILGAAFETGGISMALQAGTALGLTFGGPLPWNMRVRRYHGTPNISSFFQKLEEDLGYKFRRNSVLLEAVTHPSFASSGGNSYQRLEFLGDSILNLAVVNFLFHKYPESSSHHLSWPRSKAVCAQALTWIAVNRLSLHKLMLVNNSELNSAINRYVPIIESISAQEIVNRGWRYDPPKAISDVFESVIGAVLVDSDYDYDKTAAVVEHIMEDILTVVSPSSSLDPTSEITEWLAATGCREFSLQKITTARKGIEIDAAVFLVHRIVISGPIVSTSLTKARFIASERALVVLKDEFSEKCLSRICTCGKKMAVDSDSLHNDDASDIQDMDDVVEILTMG